MRPRALLFLLALTAGDYLLWRWSIADNHDVLSLLAGFTLVPLVAVSVVRLVLAGARLLSSAVGLASTGVDPARGVAAAPRDAGNSAAAEPNSSSSGRLAA